MRLKDCVKEMKVWRRGDERAPHKPLLVLYVLGRYLRGDGQLIGYSSIESNVRELLEAFGPPRAAVHPEYPFWHLKSDGFWDVQSDAPIVVKQGKSPPPKQLRDCGARGGFLEPFFREVSDRAELAVVVRVLLEESFPQSLHNDILRAVGIDLTVETLGLRRDSKFREKVLGAYRCSCAVCGFSASLASSVVGIDAAHIKWHQAGGPATLSNGVALCAIHHRLLDVGMITVDENMRVLIAGAASGRGPFEELVERLHGSPIYVPEAHEHHLSPEFLEWHWREVFHTPARSV